MRTPSEQPQNNPNISENTRLRVIAVFTAFFGVMTMAPNGLSGGDYVPMCNQIGGHRTPDDPPFLHGKKAEGKVVCVVDGDTIDVKLDSGPSVRIRLWGVDCPESNFNDKCMRSGYSACAKEVIEGKKVSQRVQRILGGSRAVTSEPPYKNDGNRLLANIRLQDGTDLGQKLTSDCLCVPKYNNKYKKNYRKNCSR